MVQTLHLHISTISHLNTLNRESLIGQGCVSVGLVKVETVEVQSEETNVGLTLAHLDIARRGGGLGPVGQVLAVRLAAARNKVATHAKSTRTSSPCSTTLRIQSFKFQNVDFLSLDLGFSIQFSMKSYLETSFRISIKNQSSVNKCYGEYHNRARIWS